MQGFNLRGFYPGSRFPSGHLSTRSTSLYVLSNVNVNNHIARAPAEQLTLLDLAPSYAIISNAHARNAYGTIAQDIACAALNLRPIPIDGRCAICPDAEDRDGLFYEIKSVHRSGKLVIYDWRIEKEATLSELHYAIVVHKAKGCRSTEALLASYAVSLELWIVPASEIHAAAKLCPVRQLLKPSNDPRCGYSRKGYVRGYRNVPLAGLRPAHTERLEFECYGKPFIANLCQQAQKTPLVK